MLRVDRASVYFVARDGRPVHALDRVSLDIPIVGSLWRWERQAAEIDIAKRNGGLSAFVVRLDYAQRARG